MGRGTVRVPLLIQSLTLLYHEKTARLAGVRKKVLKQNLITASVRQDWDNKKVRSG